MKRVIKKSIINRFTSKFLLVNALKLHSFSLRLADIISIEREGVHPKHRLMKYKYWFLKNISPGWIVLDVGSNIGLMTESLAEKAGFVYGIEIDPRLCSIAKANRNLKNTEYICADATKFDFKSTKKIDCVILSNVLEHIDRRVDFLKALKSDVRWMDPAHKRFLFRVPMLNRDWVVLYKKELGLEYFSDKSHFTEYSLEDFEKELSESGLRINEFEIRFGEIWAVCESF